VYSFKAPSAEDIDHDFMWRSSKALPERGRIGIFNRSYYEETLVVRVHPEFLQKQKLPPAIIRKRLWKERFEDINALNDLNLTFPKVSADQKAELERIRVELEKE
jgi:polyphosphate kinase 2 (PPK2 family)